MKRVFLIILLVILCSCYYFPVTLVAFPIANSKMILAAMGLLFFLWNHLKYRSTSIRKELFPVLLLGIIFSLSSFFSVVYNDTNDYVFATYFVSMCVWLGGAYCIIYLLKTIYKTVTIRIVFFYLALVCAAQCILAVMIDNIPALQNIVDSTFGISSEYFEKNPRLYGIGAAFDTAGIRFSCVLVAVGYMIKNSYDRSEKNFYIILLLIIGVIGNMISRTTIVGLAIAFVYIFSSSFSWIKENITSKGFFWGIGMCVFIIVLFYFGTYMYNNIPQARKVFEYGFEGFINLFKTGTYSTHSSDLLLDYIFDIYPDNLKTWIIGDGYFADPYDPNKFYMGTDMGYIRFIFYCGIIGLLCFLSYFICCTYVLCKRELNKNLFFICIFFVQLIVWIKIPTDIFCFYALMLLADNSIEFKGDDFISNRNYSLRIV